MKHSIFIFMLLTSLFRVFSLSNDSVAKEQINDKYYHLSGFYYPNTQKYYLKEKFPAGIDSVDTIFFDNDCFKQNNPFGFKKNVAYREWYENGGKVIQWLYEGCLFDFGGLGSTLSYSTTVFLHLSGDDRKKLFDKSFVRFFVYEGVWSYTTTSGAYNKVPAFTLFFYPKNEVIAEEDL